MTIMLTFFSFQDPPVHISCTARILSGQQRMYGDFPKGRLQYHFSQPNIAVNFKLVPHYVILIIIR